MPPPPLLAAASSSRSEPRPIIKTSKDWKVPPRPKPGRRPKAVVEAEAAEQARKTASGLRENRQVAALQDKIRALEQREGAKVVALQRRAADATAEVQHLRTENGQLHALVAQLRTQLDAARHTQQHPEMTEGADRDEVCTRSTKRRRTQGAATAVATAFDDLGSPYMSGHAPLSPNSSSAAHSPPHDSDRLYTLQPVASTSALTNDSCGYCSASSGGCFCGSADTNNGYIGSTAASPMDERVKLEPDFAVEAPTQNQLPLPIRQRPKSAFRAQPASLWALNPAQPTSTADKPALCNGDPSNCPACSDDPFGKAFCESLSQSVCATSPCDSCPSHAASAGKKPIPTPPPELEPLSAAAAAARQAEAEAEARLFDQLTDLPCCGDPAMCGSLTCGPAKETSTAEIEMLPKSVPTGVRSVADKIPCNEAWTTLKNHPNIAFADLQMLAEVVARRTRCDGPIPITVTAPADPSDAAPTAPPETSPGKLCVSDANPSQQRRRLTVEREAVNEALGILDRAGRA